MRIKIEFSCDNAAFEDNPDEISVVLQQAAEAVEVLRLEIENMCATNVARELYDTNGNRVGYVRVTR